MTLISSFPYQIILDTDPGGDDIFTLLLLQSLIKQGLAELIAITTAEGNVSPRQTFANASQVLKLINSSSIEVGKSSSMAGSNLNDATHIHGDDGMGNLSHSLPQLIDTFDLARTSEDIIIEKLSQYPGIITIIAIAPLTNLARAERKSPGILQKAKEIVIMGGAFQTYGNINPVAEFNIAFDPEAAQTVLSSRNDIVILSLDISHQLILTHTMVESIAQENPGNPVAQFLIDLSNFMVKTTLKYRETGGIPGFLVHDASTLGYLFYPETLQFKRAKLSVETKGEFTKGETIIDFRHIPKTNCNAWVACQVDAQNLLANFVADLKVLIT